MSVRYDDDASDGSPLGGRLRWLGAALVLAMLGGLVWFAVHTGAAVAPELLDDPLDDVGPPSWTLSRLATQNELRLPGGPGSVVDRGLDGVARPTPPLADDETELCGVGAVKATDDGQPRDLAPVRSAARQAREQVLPLLLASRDDVPRAAGLLMVALDDGGAKGAAPSPQRARDELASMAAFTGSPPVYAWAMRACQGRRDDGVCRMLNPEQWARLEPGNAVAWLHVAADAQARRDAAAVADAMYRVSQAPRSDARRGLLASTVLTRLPPEVDLLARAGLAAELTKLDAQAVLPLVAASQHCGPRELLDVNRLQVCASVADRLHERGSTLAEAALAASIGERAGWPAERVALAAEEHDALSQLALQVPHGATGPHPWGCAALAQALSRVHEGGRQGELAALRAALARSPEGRTALAQRHRAATALRVASAASAASAPALP